MDKKRILVVDDDPAVCRLLAAVLEKCNFDVDTADNGREGVTRASCGKFDLILLDLHMPRMTGQEVIAQLRAAANTRHIPIVVLSANGTRDNVLQARKAGADDFVAKSGFQIESFLERIESALQKSKERTEELPPWLNETFQKLGIVPEDVLSPPAPENSPEHEKSGTEEETGKEEEPEGTEEKAEAAAPQKLPT